MTQPYGGKAAYFKWTLLLVLCNRLVTCSFAALTLVVSNFASGRAMCRARFFNALTTSY